MSCSWSELCSRKTLVGLVTTVAEMARRDSPSICAVEASAFSSRPERASSSRSASSSDTDDEPPAPSPPADRGGSTSIPTSTAPVVSGGGGGGGGDDDGGGEGGGGGGGGGILSPASSDARFVTRLGLQLIHAAEGHVTQQLAAAEGAEGREVWETKLRALHSLPWKFVVIDSGAVNAFVTDMLPGYVFVHRGLLDAFDRNEEELAFILGHELSHYLLDHGARTRQVPAPCFLPTTMTCLPACPPARLPASLPPYLPTCVPPFRLPDCLSACLPFSCRQVHRCYSSSYWRR